MRSAEVIKRIGKAGWAEIRQTGSHKHFRHPTLPGTVTVPYPKSENCDRNAQEHRKTKRRTIAIAIYPLVTLLIKGSCVMATVYYPAVIERAESGFSVFFPDLPGCASAGGDMQEAALGAEEALSGHLAVMADHGDPIPEPSAIDAVERDPDVEEAARILVRGERPGRAVRVQVSIDEGLLARIDRIANNRSRFLADAARAKLAAMN